MLKIRVGRAMLRVSAAAAISLLIALSAPAQTVRYIHTDGLGSVVLTTDKDRNIVERSEYEPYGSLLNRPLTDGPSYTGHVTDVATGLTYMQQRYYDPIIGKMLSVDPVTVYASGDLQHFNVYVYANNNPYLFNDPNGRQSVSVVYADKSAPTPEEKDVERIGRDIVSLTSRAVRAGGSKSEINNLKKWHVKINTTISKAPKTGGVAETGPVLTNGDVTAINSVFTNRISELEGDGDAVMNGGLVAAKGDSAKEAFGTHEFAHGNKENVNIKGAVDAENAASDRAVDIIKKDKALEEKPRIER